MNPILSAVTEIFLFLSLYIQVFLIITLFEHRNSLDNRPGTAPLKPGDLPTVSVVVPCFNEQATVIGTIESLKSLNYPQDKLSIIAVDDGSTDDTWVYLKRYENDPRISIFRKENGGKHSAVNLALEKSTSDIIGCLDADSFVHPEALNRMMPLFADPTVMAVTPAVKVRSPRNILERMQSAEYNIGIFLRKMYGSMDAIHVTPGPFSMFRRSVFDKVGPWKSAHNTEDLEMALRLHRNNLKIENAEHAYVYTTPPSGARALIKQRVRWTTGFLLNLKDYRDLLFSRKHGHVGWFTLPAGVLSLVAVLFFAGSGVVNAAVSAAGDFTRWQLIGWSWNWPSWHWFFFDTTIIRLLTFALLISAVAFIFFGKRMASGSWKPSRDMLYYGLFYGFFAPIWIGISGFRALANSTGSWR